MFDVIIPSAGSGTRMKSEKNKLFMPLPDGRCVLYHTITKFVREDVGRIIIPHRENDREKIEKVVACFPSLDIVTLIGGSTRTETVSLALNHVSADTVLIHDGARPFVTGAVIDRVLEGTAGTGACIPVVTPTDTVKVTDGRITLRPIDRDTLALVQTPQGFLTEGIRRAYSKITPDKRYTDDASVYEEIGSVSVVEGDRENIKITTPSDLPHEYRTGVGFDAHRFDESRPLILGGIRIPSDRGLLGHSDADVVLHSLMDALLSSIHMRDIGYHFPCTPEFKGAKSTDLLKTVLSFLEERGAEIVNVAIVIVAEKPKLSPHVNAISDNIASLLSVTPDRVSLTATTTEKLGFTGREEGIACEAVCTVRI